MKNQTGVGSVSGDLIFLLRLTGIPVAVDIEQPDQTIGACQITGLPSEISGYRQSPG